MEGFSLYIQLAGKPFIESWVILIHIRQTCYPFLAKCSNSSNLLDMVSFSVPCRFARREQERQLWFKRGLNSGDGDMKGMSSRPTRSGGWKARGRNSFVYLSLTLPRRNSQPGGRSPERGCRAMARALSADALVPRSTDGTRHHRRYL